MTHLFFNEVLILTGVATMVVTACHFLNIPSMVGFILTGIAIGPSGLRLVPSLPDANALTEIAGIILMFTIGLEFSFTKLKQLKSQLMYLGASQVLITVLLVIILGVFFTDLNMKQLTIWGFLISLSSTALVMKLLNEYRETTSPQGKNSLGILLFQDLAVVPMMILMPLIASGLSATGVFDFNGFFIMLAKFLILLPLLLLGIRYALPWVLENVTKTKNQEIFFFCIVFVCLGIGTVFQLIGLSLTLGAFVAGVLISESAYSHQTMSIFGSLRDTFLGLFFATVGMLLDLRFVADNLPFIVGIGSLILLAKFSVVLIICLFARVSLPIAIITGLTVCQLGEFSFILSAQALELNLISPLDSHYFLSISVLSMMATPFLYRLAPKIALSKVVLQWKSLAQIDETIELSKQLSHLDKPDDGSGHTIIIGFGVVGRNLAEALISLSLPVKIIEFNIELIKRNKKSGFDIMFGDATRIEVLHRANLETARMVVLSVSAQNSVPIIIAAIRKVRPDIPIVIRLQYVLELAGLYKDPNVSYVVAEIETATELVTKVLLSYGVDTETVFNYTVTAGTQLESMAELGSGLRYKSINLPTWEAVASIRPYVIKSGSFAADRSIAELSLPKRVGGTVVSIYREGLGAKMPDGDFVLRSHDVIQVSSSPEQFKAIENLLAHG